MSKTAIVILNYNGENYLQQFLPSVIQYSGDATIIVADNGSTDNSVAILQAQFPQVDLLQLNQNYGFAGGYNKALTQIDADYFLLLNSDVKVTPNWLTPLVNTLDNNPHIAACQPKIKAYDNHEYFEHAGAAGGFIDYLGYPFCRGRILSTVEEDKGQYDTPTSIFWASGAAILVRAELFVQLGGFDDKYFAHFEEIDLCWRIKRAGYDIQAIPSSTVYHKGGGTLAYENPKKTFLNFRNNLMTLYKNKPGGISLFFFIFFRLVLDGLAGVLFLTQGKFSHIIAIIKAHFAFYSLLPYLSKQKKSDKQKIAAIHIDTPNTKGVYHKSMLWQYYAKGQQTFNNLIEND